MPVYLLFYTDIYIYISGIYMVRSIVDKTFDYFVKTKYYCTYNSVLHRVIISCLLSRYNVS